MFADLGALFFSELSRPFVVCDIDNVLAFHAEAACCALNARFGTNPLPVAPDRPASGTPYFS